MSCLACRDRVDYLGTGEMRKPLNYVRIVVLFFTFLVFFGMARKVWAGGDNESVDPLNGCFEKIGYSGEELATEQRDWANNRDKYRKMIDKDRFARSTQCWQGRAYCIKLATVCRKDGKIVYDGFDWMVRQK